MGKRGWSNRGLIVRWIIAGFVINLAISYYLLEWAKKTKTDPTTGSSLRYMAVHSKGFDAVRTRRHILYTKIHGIHAFEPLPNNRPIADALMMYPEPIWPRQTNDKILFVRPLGYSRSITTLAGFPLRSIEHKQYDYDYDTPFAFIHMTTVHIGGSLVNIIFYGGIAVALVSQIPPIDWPMIVNKVAARRSRGLCPRCAYDLLGDHASGCPECGWNKKQTQSDS